MRNDACFLTPLSFLYSSPISVASLLRSGFITPIVALTVGADVISTRASCSCCLAQQLRVLRVSEVRVVRVVEDGGLPEQPAAKSSDQLRRSSGGGDWRRWLVVVPVGRAPWLEPGGE